MGQGCLDNLIPGAVLDEVEARVPDLLRGERGARIRDDRGAVEASRDEFIADAAAPFQLGVEGGNKERGPSCSNCVHLGTVAGFAARRRDRAARSRTVRPRLAWAAECGPTLACGQSRVHLRVVNRE